MASQCGMPEFREKYATVESLVHLWEENVPFALVPVTDSPNSTENKGFKVSKVKLRTEILYNGFMLVYRVRQKQLSKVFLTMTQLHPQNQCY